MHRRFLTALLLAGVAAPAILAQTVSTGDIENNAVTNEKIADDAVQARHIDDNAVTEDAIDNGAIVARHLKDNAVTEDAVDTNAITSRHIANGTNRSVGPWRPFR